MLLLDEPTSNLDARARISLREDLERVARDEARAAILSTHDLAEAFYIADRVAVLSEGRVIQIDTPSALYEHPHNEFSAAVTGAEFGLIGTAVGRDDRLVTVDVGGATLTALGSSDPGESVKVAYRPEDLLLASTPISGGSARNVVQLKVLEVRPAGGFLRVRLGGPPELVAVITRAAGEELDVTPGEIVLRPREGDGTARVSAELRHSHGALGRGFWLFWTRTSFTSPRPKAPSQRGCSLP